MNKIFINRPGEFTLEWDPDKVSKIDVSRALWTLMTEVNAEEIDKGDVYFWKKLED